MIYPASFTFYFLFAEASQAITQTSKLESIVGKLTILDVCVDPGYASILFLSLREKCPHSVFLWSERTRKTPNPDTFHADFTLTFLRFAETHAKWRIQNPVKHLKWKVFPRIKS